MDKFRNESLSNNGSGWRKKKRSLYDNDEE